MKRNPVVVNLEHARERASRWQERALLLASLGKAAEAREAREMAKQYRLEFEEYMELLKKGHEKECVK